METAQKSRAKYWILFFVWLVIMVAMLINPSWRPFFWLALPGVVTYFAYSMDLVGTK
jgi:4-hydroxybenzoate polyprenyltransferase